MSTTTKLFRSNRTQAVRLPKDVAFPDSVTEVEIIKVGDTRVIVPAGQRWGDYFSRPSRPTDDFLAERRQGTFEDREPL